MGSGTPSTAGVVPAALRVGTTPASVVFARLRAAGPVTRDRLADHPDLSTATVNRQLHALVEAGLIVERPGTWSTAAGSVGPKCRSR